MICYIQFCHYITPVYILHWDTSLLGQINNTSSLLPWSGCGHTRNHHEDRMSLFMFQHVKTCEPETLPQALWDVWGSLTICPSYPNSYNENSSHSSSNDVHICRICRAQQFCCVITVVLEYSVVIYRYLQ